MEKVSTAQRLKEYMSTTGLKQKDILNKAQPYCKKYNVKLGKNDLSQYVSGKVNPSQKKLSVLSKALNVNPVWLMGYDVTQDPSQHILDMEVDQLVYENICVHITKFAPITLDDVIEAQNGLMYYYEEHKNDFYSKNERSDKNEK